MEYEIIAVRSYFEVHINGRFYCTADNENEAMQDIEDYERMNLNV